MKIVLYQLAETGRLKHLVMSVESNVIVTEWWTSKEGVDGKKQITSETIIGKNTGRSNETSDAEQAILEFERKIRKKKEEGYAESLEKALEGHLAVVNEVLPSSFAPCKPINKLKPKDEPFDGSWIAERKYNGVCLLLQNTGKERVAYSRRIKPITELVSVVPDIVENLNKVPENSLIIGELVAFDGNKMEDPKALKGVTTETTTVAKAKAKYDTLSSEGYIFDYYIFDIIFWKGNDITQLPFTERKELSLEFGDRKIETFTEAMSEEGHKLGWEGFILRRPDDTITFTMNGKPKRKGAYKYKFIETTDCIVTGVSPGSGKHEVRFARFRLAQYENSPLTGEKVLVDCGWAGGGRLGEENMDIITQELISKGYNLEKQELKEEDLFAVELEFQSRQTRNKKGQLCFEFPIITRTREDKPIAECEV
jgi:ATP-dependent DNA ligase